VLVQLDRVGRQPLQEATVDGWLAKAPSKLAKEYLLAQAADRRA